MTLSTFLSIIVILVFICGFIFAIKHFSQQQREEALSDILITTGIELIITSFGTFDDKLLAFLSNSQTQTNYVQLVIGILLLAVGIIFYFYIKNRLYILNINGYFDKRIEQHHNDLNLSSFEFKEREIDFIRLFRKGINSQVAQDIQEEINEKITTFKTESKDKSRAYTGIAPIPFIFVAGKLFARENIDRYFEYDKFNQSYYSLATCRKKRKPYSTLEQVTSMDSTSDVTTEEIVVAISVTQQITAPQLIQFSSPIIHVSIKQPGDNAIKYKDQLDAYTKTIYEILLSLPNHFHNLKRIHLLYSGQSCLAFEVGKLIDDNRMVEIINYQYVQNNQPKYPWGIVLNGERKGTYIES